MRSPPSVSSQVQLQCKKQVEETEVAVVAHVHFTLPVMTLCTAFHLWQARVASEPTNRAEVTASLSTALLQGEGTAWWRLQLKEENHDKVLVFIWEVYELFQLDSCFHHLLPSPQIRRSHSFPP